jgi:hypothetical protein
MQHMSILIAILFLAAVVVAVVGAVVSERLFQIAVIAALVLLGIHVFLGV